MKEMVLKYKNWWINLASREKKGIIAGASLSIFFIIYQCVWTPYLEKIDMLRKKIKTNHALIQWMQTTNSTINQLETKTTSAMKSRSPIVVLGYLKGKIDEAGLHESLTQLKQISNDSVELHFQKVEFDKWIRLLINVIKEQKLLISQLSVAADNTQGLVNVDLILRV